MGNQAPERPAGPSLPEMAMEYQITRDRWGKVSGEVLIVRGMTEKYFFPNVESARQWFLDTPPFNVLHRDEPIAEALADSTPPEKCPECGQTDKGWFDNRTDEDRPNWRCKNKVCGHRVYIEVPAEGQEALPGVEA